MKQKPLEDKQPKRQEPTPIEEIRADKTAPPERAKVMSTKEQSQKKQFKGGVSI